MITKTYLILDSGANLIKIGRSVNVEDRLKSLQCGCGSRLEIKHVFDADIEDLLHIEFCHARKHGEWFDVNYREVVNFVNTDKNMKGAYAERMDTTIRIKPVEKKLSKSAKYLIGFNKWIELMKVGEKVGIPDDQKLSSTKLLCKRYGEITGKRFFVEPKRNQITRLV